MAPRGFGSFISMYLAGRVIGRVDARLLIGIGLTYVTLTTVAFATLGVQYRSEGTSTFNLLRNVGAGRYGFLRRSA